MHRVLEIRARHRTVGRLDQSASRARALRALETLETEYFTLFEVISHLKLFIYVLIPRIVKCSLGGQKFEQSDSLALIESLC